jgi:hypothetical protein
MPEPSRIVTLKTKHADLESQIFDEQRRPSPDYVLVHELKRRKLQLKDEMQRAPVN